MNSTQNIDTQKRPVFTLFYLLILIFITSCTSNNSDELEQPPSTEVTSTNPSSREANTCSKAAVKSAFDALGDNWFAKITGREPLREEERQNLSYGLKTIPLVGSFQNSDCYELLVAFGTDVEAISHIKMWRLQPTDNNTTKFLPEEN